MGSVPVVLVDPWFEAAVSFCGVLIEAGIGPFPDGGLDEALGLAVGARGVDAGADVFESEVTAGIAEPIGIEAGAVVGHHWAELDVVAGEVGGGLAEEAAGGGCLFIRHHGDVGYARVIVDGDIEELPTCAASLILGVAGDAVTGLVDARQLLDIDVDQIAGGGIFIADDRRLQLEHPNLVELQPGQDAADGGPAQACGLRDPHSGPTLSAKTLDLKDQFARSAARRATRTTRSVL